MSTTPEQESALLLAVEQAHKELCEAIDTFLNAARGCRSRSGGDVDSPQDLKLAEALKDMAIKTYQEASRAYVAAVWSQINP